MERAVIGSVKDLVGQEGVIMGAARAEALNNQAPEGFRPMDMMPEARTVLAFAKPLPLAVFLTPDKFDNLFYQRSAYMHYSLMDNLANKACMMLQGAGFSSLPIPAYSPLRFYEGEPRGVISLKHAAAEAGLGTLGRSSLLISKEHGNVMRLGALMTEMEWPEYGGGNGFEPCAKDCRACEKACPAGAIRDSGVDKTSCLGTCIKHALLPPSFMLPLVKKAVAGSTLLTRVMELLSLNFFETYGIGCTACLKACPHFPGRKKKSVATA